MVMSFYHNIQESGMWCWTFQ